MLEASSIEPMTRREKLLPLEMGLGLPRDFGLWGGAGVETVKILERVDLKESIGATCQEPKQAEAPKSRVKVRRTGALYIRGK